MRGLFRFWFFWMLFMYSDLVRITLITFVQFNDIQTIGKLVQVKYPVCIALSENNCFLKVDLSQHIHDVYIYFSILFPCNINIEFSIAWVWINADVALIKRSFTYADLFYGSE